ncbi:MAG: DUF721 domain-containing protein [Bacteroidota bacterium]
MKKHNDQSLKEVLQALTAQRQLRGKLKLTQLRRAWPRLMGPTISGYTTDLSLRQQTLYIHLNSAPLRQELNLGREKIRHLLNEELGEEFLREVVIR